MLILLIGGHYTYAKVPLFNYLRDTFDLERNYYDRVGHFMQGFVPALLIRKILVKVVGIQKKGWLELLVISVCLAFSAFIRVARECSCKINGDRSRSISWNARRCLGYTMGNDICVNWSDISNDSFPR